MKRLSQASPEIRGEFLATMRRQLGVDAPPELQDAGSATCRRFALLTASELGELAAAGMQIGAHTLSHPVLSQAPAVSAYSEIADEPCAARGDATIEDLGIRVSVWRCAICYA